MPDPLIETWGNYETWIIADWLEHDRKILRKWKQRAAYHVQKAQSNPDVVRGIWTVEYCATAYLVREMSEAFQHAARNFPVPYKSFLTKGMMTVDWAKIALSLIRGTQ